MADSFPRQHARTQRFTLGQPRSFSISPDGKTVLFLRSRNGTDPVTCLWALDAASGTERLVADPRLLGQTGEVLDPQEKARRERTREQAGGIVSFATDEAFAAAVFSLAGRVYLAGLDAGGEIRELAVRTPAVDPRLSPSGEHVAYACAGALRIVSARGVDDRAVADPGSAADVTFGLAEFIAAEEMDRTRGYWWAPDSAALLAARVDESPVRWWHISDPASPDRPATAVRYPAAGTANALVTLAIFRLDGQATEVSWDHAQFPYLVTAEWAQGHPPLIVVQSRDQRRMQILAVEPGTGRTEVIRDDTGVPWLEIVPGVPAWTSGGLLVWTADDADTRRLLVAAPQQLAGGSAAAVTPAGLQVRGILSVDGDTVLFAASGAEPAEIGLWRYGPGGLQQVAGDASGGGGRDGGPGPGDPGRDGGPQVRSGRQAGGTTVLLTQSLRHDGTRAAVMSGGTVTGIASRAESPLLPVPEPDIFAAGPLGIRTAIVLPSWHQRGSAALPVLMCPYGGPHGQMVQASRAAFWTAQWFADQGFAVVVADGRGTPGRGPRWEHAVAGDLAGVPLADQVAALEAAAARCADLDTGKVGIRGWSFGGYLSALAVLRRPDVFHAAVAGAPVTDQRLYDTHYTERYLGHPDEQPEVYERNNALADAHRLSRPLMIIHGLADDNVFVAHSLRLSSALLAAGRPHTLLPLTGVTHMASQEEVAENLLLLQVDFLRQALGLAAPGGVARVTAAAADSDSR